MNVHMSDLLYELRTRGRVWLLRLRFAFRRQWFIYDWVDECVHYEGTFRNCGRVIDFLPGGEYSVVSKLDYNEHLSPVELEDSWNSCR